MSWKAGTMWWVQGESTRWAGPGKGVGSNGRWGWMAIRGLLAKRAECWAKENGLSFSKNKNQWRLLLSSFLFLFFSTMATWCVEGISLCIDLGPWGDGVHLLQVGGCACGPPAPAPENRTDWLGFFGHRVYVCWVWGLGVISFERDNWASSAQLVYKNPGELFSRPWRGGAGGGGQASMFSSDPINRWRCFFLIGGD